MDTARPRLMPTLVPVLLLSLFLSACALAQEAAEPAAAAEATAAAEAEAPAASMPHLIGAVEFNGHYYKIIEVEGTSWEEQKKICEALGGHLAVIETKEEQEFIAKLADWEYYSLGATDKEEEGEWKWVNGAPFDFTAWMDGQPNNYAGEEHYLATYDEGLWVDVAVEGRQFWMPRGFICEWEETAAERQEKEKAEAKDAEDEAAGQTVE